ncbi:transcription factor RcaD [Scytonema sp. UIC 10036]|uniref:transcription factor RcaD n=1 Tax=Scytonema sp. UIC 10036 TaxID=2304196 RepID=UPI0012DA3D2E|nr:transcription factor RcaD [Scytonema sp. UIC 10036]MUG99279.1 transcription factor RcaD [Scytonema sp. UIC 10036]
MDTHELKFLLKLLGCSNYRSSLSSSTFKSFEGKEKICKSLSARNLIDFSHEIASIKILPPGEALLNTETQELPLNNNELKVLKKISNASETITPSKINIKSLKSQQRDAILQNLYEKGLIEVETKIKKINAEVWLTEHGIEYLRDRYIPEGNAIVSLELLKNYLQFIRKFLPSQPEPLSTPEHTNGGGAVVTIVNLTDQEILHTIKNLEREVGTDNGLPIFHLREKLQPFLSEEELDRALFRLEEADEIKLRKLVEPKDYTQDKMDDEIPQSKENSLLYITVRRLG